MSDVMSGPDAIARLTGVGLLWMGVHCAGMCGPLLLGLDVGGSRGGASAGGVACRTLLYQSGKAISYAVVGAFAGAVGSAAANVDGHVTAVAAIVTGVVAVAVALGLFPRRASPTTRVVNIGQPPTTTERLLALARPALTSTHPLRPFLLGLVLAFLPCMISLWALSLAALTSSPLWGALVMLTLAACTTLLLIVTSLLGRSASLLSPSTRRALQTAGGIVAGAWLIAIGLAALGVVDHAHLPLHVGRRAFTLMLF